MYMYILFHLSFIKYTYIHDTCTVQDDLLVREIFGEFVSEIQLVDFILVILL